MCSGMAMGTCGQSPLCCMGQRNSVDERGWGVVGFWKAFSVSTLVLLVCSKVMDGTHPPTHPPTHLE